MCVFKRGRWVPVRELPSLSFVKLPQQLLVPVWWVLDGSPAGFRELGVRLPARRVLRFLKSLGLLEKGRKRVKRIVVYAKGKEVHVDVATCLSRDEVELLGPSAHWRDFVFAFLAIVLACLAAGVDKRVLASLLAAAEAVVG